MIFRYILPAMLAATLCPNSVHASDEEPHVFLASGELNYVGKLSAKGNARLFALYNRSQRKPTTLAIHSPGGDTGLGMALGKWVYKKKLDVKVLEGCHSSCANYVFPAARNKIVSNFAVIGYHGGLTSTSFGIDDAALDNLAALQKDGEKVTRENAVESIKRLFASQLEQESKYFKMIGVQQRITTLGQSEEYKKAAPEDAVGWYYSAEDFAKLGVSNITVINPPWRPESNPSPIVVFRVTVE